MKRSECHRLLPYLLPVSKEAELSGVVTKNVVLPSASAQFRRYLKGLWKKKPLEKTVEKCRENYGEGWTKGNALNNSVPDCAKSKVENPATAARSCSDEDIARKKKAGHDVKLRM
jgi:hypothetical protein